MKDHNVCPICRRPIVNNNGPSYKRHLAKCRVKRARKWRQQRKGVGT